MHCNAIKFILTVLLLLLATATNARAEKSQILIVQNGGGGPLPENTLEAATLAVAQDVTYLELPVVLSADEVPILFDDLVLGDKTDVAEIFPEKRRDDGFFYVIDFTSPEIRQLSLIDQNAGETSPLLLGIPTLAEELALLRKLEKQFGQSIGLMIEIKHPWFHRANNKDLSRKILETLGEYQYDAADEVYLQCFDPEELQNLHKQLMAEQNLSFPLIQLLDTNNGNDARQFSGGQWVPYQYDWLFTNTGLRIVKSYASAIGFPQNSLTSSENPEPLIRFLEQSQKYKLQLFVLQPAGSQPLEEIPASVLLSQDSDLEERTIFIDGYYVNGYVAENKWEPKQQDRIPEYEGNLYMPETEQEDTEFSSDTYEQPEKRRNDPEVNWLN